MSLDNNASTGANGAGGSIASAGAMAMFSGMVGSVKEKWDASGGNEIVSKVSSNIPQGTKDYIGSAQSKFLNPKYLRSVKVFFGLGEERPFFFETSPSLLLVRLQHNMAFFYLNYLLMTVILFVLTLIINPTAIVGMVILGFGWLYVVRSAAAGEMTIKGITVSSKTASIVMGVLSALILFWLLKSVFWWAVFSSGFFAGLHALFRDASMHKDEEDQVQMMGDFSEEDAAFLNPVGSDIGGSTNPV